MLKVIDKVSLHDDKRFARNVFLKLLDKVTYPIELYETNNAVSFRSDVLPTGRRLDLWEIKRPGVYIIYYNNEIIYIGQSERNMHTRIVRFLKAFLDCQGFTERHPGGQKFREYMKRSYDSIPETEKPMSGRHTAAVATRDELCDGSLENTKYSGMAKWIGEKQSFDEWLWCEFVWHHHLEQPLAISICPIDEHFYAINNEGENAHLTDLERPYLDEFLAGAMKRIPKFNSKVQKLFDNQLFDDPSGITNDQIAEKLENFLHQRGLVPRPRHNNSNIENLVMEKKDMTTIFEDLTEQDHAWLDGLNRANSGFRNKVLDQVLSLDVDKGFKFPTVSKSGFTQGSWVRKKALESNPNIVLTFKKKENYCYVKRTA